MLMNYFGFDYLSSSSFEIMIYRIFLGYKENFENVYFKVKGYFWGIRRISKREFEGLLGKLIEGEKRNGAVGRSAFILSFDLEQFAALFPGHRYPKEVDRRGRQLFELFFRFHGA